MIQRCNNSNCPNFNNYGGRGITVCDRWLESFENFYEDMGERPEGMTLDRIDVNGNYEPSNCRWSTNSEQNFNRRKMSTNTSGRTGIYFAKNCNKWRASITFNYKCIYLGSFNNFEDAVKVREEAELKYFGEIKNE